MMKWFDYDHVQRIVVIVGLAVVFGLWAAEDAGLILVASPNAAPADGLPLQPGAAPLPPSLVLQGVIAGDGSAAPAALLAEAGRRPVLVPEGGAFNEDIRVDRVLRDRVVLHWRGSHAPIVVPLSPLAGHDVPITPPAATVAAPVPTAPAARAPVSGGVSPEGIPLPPPDMVPPPIDETLPARRLPAPVDASGLPPGPGLSGPALPGPAAEGR